LDPETKNSCTDDTDCLRDRVCVEDRCQDPEPGGGEEPCDRDDDCRYRYTCEGGTCVPFSVVEFVAAWTDTWCTASARCCPNLSTPERLIECRAQPLFTGLPDEPVRLIDDALECLDRTANMQCDLAEPTRFFFVPGEEPCMRVIRDHARPVGGSCDETQLCADGVCAGSICTARPPGESCCIEVDGETVCDSLVCADYGWCDSSNNVCMPPLGAGEPCSFHQQCEFTLCEPTSSTCVVPSFVGAWCPV
jgi:hypothetical protein